MGIEIELQSAAEPHVDLETGGQILIHWPQDGVVDTGESSTSDFHELDDPGIHMAYATFAGDAAQSIACT